MPLLQEFALSSDLPREDDIQFRRQTRCVAALVERHFTPFKTPDIWKVLVKCTAEYFTDRASRIIGGVLTVETNKDPRNFLALSNEKKKRFAFEALSSGIEFACRIKNWPRDPFEKALNASVSVSLINQWIFGKPKFSPSRKLLARIECIHDVEQFIADLVILDRSEKVVARFPIVKSLPIEFCFVPMLGTFSWNGNSEVVVVTTEGKTQPMSVPANFTAE